MLQEHLHDWRSRGRCDGGWSRPLPASISPAQPPSGLLLPRPRVPLRPVGGVPFLFAVERRPVGGVPFLLAVEAGPSRAARVLGALRLAPALLVGGSLALQLRPSLLLGGLLPAVVGFALGRGRALACLHTLCLHAPCVRGCGLLPRRLLACVRGCGLPPRFRGRLRGGGCRLDDRARHHGQREAETRDRQCALRPSVCPRLSFHSRPPVLCHTCKFTSEPAARAGCRSGRLASPLLDLHGPPVSIAWLCIAATPFV